MRAISSHRDLRGSKMRFLIVSAVLACAAAAPSHLLAPVTGPVIAPVAVAGVQAVPIAYSAAVPTLSPGDVQAAAIDAQVKAQDLAIAAADKARELSELASEDVKEKVEVSQDVAKEANEDVFWAVQDKQWQALDALKTAEAQIDGAVASSAPVLAKNAVAGTYIAGIAPLTAPLAPLATVAFTPGVIAPALKAAEPAKEEAKVEEAKTEEKSEALVKSAEENKEKESVVVEAATRNLDAKPQLAPLAIQPIAPLAIQPYYSQGYPIVAPVASLSPVAVSPVLKYGAWPQVGITSVVKTAW